MHEDSSDSRVDPLVSIGVPCYGRPEKLLRILQQIECQSYSNIAVIVSDNCHPSLESSLIAIRFAEKDPRFTVYRQSENIGPFANHDFVFEKCTSEFFMWLADDDEINSTYVEECVSVLLANPNVALVGGAGHRYKNGAFWYDYERWDSVGVPVFARLRSLIDIAFVQHWKFEHYWCGLFRKSHAATMLSRDFKAVLFHFFVLRKLFLLPMFHRQFS